MSKPSIIAVPRPASAVVARSALFISHANPEDNVFTTWLGARLEALGFEVWADILRLGGGSDWEAKLEYALRHRARKVLFVGTPAGAAKRGPRNELEIATRVASALNDDEFIIPLRVEPYEPPFRIAHAQYIDFEGCGWARGLSELLSVLEAAGMRPSSSPPHQTAWRQVQLIHARSIVDAPETLISNWLSIDRLPATVRFYDFQDGIAHHVVDERLSEAPWPVVRHLRGFLSFAAEDDLKPHFGEQLRFACTTEISTEAFLAEGVDKPRIFARDARKHIANLTRQAIETAFRARLLTAQPMGARTIAWWPQLEVAPKGKVGFQWDDLSGQRLLHGFSRTRNIHWHFGVSVGVRVGSHRYVDLTGRLIFSEDGRTALRDSRRAHRLRRSFAKGWRNARWRDMLLAFLYWLGDGGNFINVPVGSDGAIWLGIPPMRFVAPVSILADNEIREADDDAEDPADDDDFYEGPEYDDDAETLSADE